MRAAHHSEDIPSEPPYVARGEDANGITVLLKII